MTDEMNYSPLREEDVDRAFDLGANSFLVKPSSIEGSLETALLNTSRSSCVQPRWTASLEWPVSFMPQFVAERQRWAARRLNCDVKHGTYGGYSNKEDLLYQAPPVKPPVNCIEL